ncbi:hypothetical protein Ct9H90mP29_20780 [bacterium]|nr:MAG: hypothetical protein Ct9H90mP29_20780 [bacterium]
MMIAAFISFLIAIFWVRIELTKINRGQNKYYELNRKKKI